MYLCHRSGQPLSQALNTILLNEGKSTVSFRCDEIHSKPSEPYRTLKVQNKKIDDEYYAVLKLSGRISVAV